MELVIELLVWLIIEVLFWGIMFWTGYIIACVLTFGRWAPRHPGEDKYNRRKPSFFITSLIGTFFWVVLGGFLVIIYMP